MTTDERQELQAHVDAGFGRLEVRLDAHDTRFDAHDARFDKLEAHIEQTTSSLIGIIEEHREENRRQHADTRRYMKVLVETLEGKIGLVLEQQEARFQTCTTAIGDLERRHDVRITALEQREE